MTEPEVIGPGEQFARQVESELAATPKLLWTSATIGIAAVSLVAVGYFQEDGSVFFLIAIALTVVAMGPLCWALGNVLWGNEFRADAERARESDRQWAEREAALDARKEQP